MFHLHPQLGAEIQWPDKIYILFQRDTVFETFNGDHQILNCIHNLASGLFGQVTPGQIIFESFIIGITHLFSCINICRVSRKLCERKAASSNIFRGTRQTLMHIWHKLWTEICETWQIFKGDLIKFCEIFTNQKTIGPVSLNWVLRIF